MTIALVVKVHDGLVLAADSATTLSSLNGDGSPEVSNIYNNANKVFNLHKGLPIGAMTWGQGNIGPASISTLAKDLRRRLMGQDQKHPDWQLDPDTYTIESVTERAREFLQDEKWEPTLQKLGPDSMSLFGFMIAGYSSSSDLPEARLIELGRDGGVVVSTALENDGTGAMWFGQPEAIARLMLGRSNLLPLALENLGATPEAAVQMTQNIQDQVGISLVNEAMPIQDAIDLAQFLVHTTIQFVRFSPGHATVGGPIEIAGITRHEGFRWVARKHYFDSRLNPAQETP